MNELLDFLIFAFVSLALLLSLCSMLLLCLAMLSDEKGGENTK